MNVTIAPGKYVVAVSGGVDSMALLYCLQSMPSLEIVVAHFNHGIRDDAQKDLKLVKAAVQRYKFPFVAGYGELGNGASEAVAREARYTFLRRVQAEHNAAGIITAHHQDDVLETAILNLSRGTGWRGLVSLGNSSNLLRPLLNYAKSEIVAYAAKHSLTWREDSTNEDQKYLRNYIRLSVIPKFTPAERKNFIHLIEDTREIGEQLDDAITIVMEALKVGNKLQRKELLKLDDQTIREVLIGWWRQNGFYSFEAQTLKRALENLKAPRSGQIVPLKGDLQMRIGRTELALFKRER